jgi:hypothetical protein
MNTSHQNLWNFNDSPLNTSSTYILSWYTLTLFTHSVNHIAFLLLIRHFSQEVMTSRMPTLPTRTHSLVRRELCNQNQSTAWYVPYRGSHQCSALGLESLHEAVLVELLVRSRVTANALYPKCCPHIPRNVKCNVLVNLNSVISGLSKE